MSLVTVNGLELWVEDTGSADSAGTTPPRPPKGTCLLLHGFPDTSEMWEAQTKALSAGGYRVIAPDLPGLGSSPGPQELAQYNLAGSVAPAMFALLDALSVEGKVSVVGHDWGAATAWTMAVINPERVERLVVLSVGYPGTYYASDPIRQKQASWYIPFINTSPAPDVEAAFMDNDWELFRAFAGANASREQLEGYIQRLGQPGKLSSSLNLYRANYTPAAFGAIRPSPPPTPLPMPVLGVHGERDAYCLEAQMVASRAAVAEGRWHFASVPGVGHWIPLEAADVVTQLLLDFLEGRIRPSPAK